MESNMKKIIAIVTVAFCLIAGSSFAQTLASDLVKKTVDKMNRHKNIEFIFELDMNNETLAVTESTSGEAYLQGEAYKLNMAETCVISDGKTLWTYLIDNEEVMVSDPNDDQSVINPIKMLTTYDKDYTIKYVKSDSKGIKAVEMNNPKGEFNKVTLKIDETKLEVIGATLTNRSGESFSIRIMKTIYDQNLDANFFTFDAKAHPNIDIIDMR